MDFKQYLPSPSVYNFFLNGAWDFWQESTSKTLTATGGGTPTPVYAYAGDQWYMNNILGGGTVEGIVTGSQVAGTLNGSTWGGKYIVSTAPTGTGIQNGLEVYQVLSNFATLPLYGQTVSAAVQVKANNNVTQVGLQFFYAITEAKPTVAIGSEVLCTVNNSGFTRCFINAVPLGTSMTTSGVIGLRIRPTAVSSGNLYDLNNGFTLEQAMLNIGTVAFPFQRQHGSPTSEFSALEYFYEKSYNQTVVPGTATQTGVFLGPQTPTGVVVGFAIPFKATKRISGGSVSIWDCAGNASKLSEFNNGSFTRTDNLGTINANTATQYGIFFEWTSGGGSVFTPGVHWVCDARI